MAAGRRRLVAALHLVDPDMVISFDERTAQASSLLGLPVSSGPRSGGQATVEKGARRSRRTLAYCSHYCSQVGRKWLQ